MNLNSRHEYVINYLKENIITKCSMRCKHAAALVDNKGNIISTGYNYIIMTNEYSHNNKKKIYSIHAERDCLMNCVNKDKIRGADLYVIRCGCEYNNKLLISQPCKNCENLINVYIKKYKLRNIYYTINDSNYD